MVGSYIRDTVSNLKFKNGMSCNFVSSPFNVQLAKSSKFANKSAPRGRPSEHRITEEAPNRRQSKAAAVPTPGHDVRYDSVADWPEAVDKKDRCRLCQAFRLSMRNKHVIEEHVLKGLPVRKIRYILTNCLSFSLKQLMHLLVGRWTSFMDIYNRIIHNNLQKEHFMLLF